MPEVSSWLAMELFTASSARGSLWSSERCARSREPTSMASARKAPAPWASTASTSKAEMLALRTASATASSAGGAGGGGCSFMMASSAAFGSSSACAGLLPAPGDTIGTQSASAALPPSASSSGSLNLENSSPKPGRKTSMQSQVICHQILTSPGGPAPAASSLGATKPRSFVPSSTQRRFFSASVAISSSSASRSSLPLLMKSSMSRNTMSQSCPKHSCLWSVGRFCRKNLATSATASRTTASGAPPLVTAPVSTETSFSSTSLAQ
mmetsp:Transcript_46651/g.141528  ORF Transcript_46651/g.141528 Transcript_46651/m.141528 type:complete len:267 (-) Transcript_46651:500-1300(-)